MGAETTSPAAYTAEVSTPGDREVVVKRRFNAPVSLVWRCYTEPELVKRWLTGYEGWTMPVCEIDLRVGGSYRYRWRNSEDGSEFGFVGTYSRVDTESRIDHTEMMEGAEDMPPSENVIAFEPLGDMTELIITMTYISAEVRQMVLDTGMTDGMGSSFDKLDELLALERH